MSLNKTLWTSIVNLVSTGKNVSDSLNVAFRNIDDAIDQIDTNANDIVALESRITAEENRNPSAISVATTLPKAEQVLVANTAEKLDYITDILVDAGGSDINVDATNNIINVTTDGIYKVYGLLTIEAPINDLVTVELYVDNLATGFVSEAIGRGTGISTTINHSFMSSFLVNDEITLYVKSTGTSVIVNTASLTVEKTEY